MKKGFTLIELLAVIVILSIIALITVPILLNVIDNAKIGTLRNSAYGIIESADLYFAQNFGKEQESILFEFSNGEQISEKKLSFKGKIDNGKVVLNKDNKVLLCIDNGKNYAYKSYSDDKVTTGLGTCGEYEQENGEIEINNDNGAIIYVNNEVVQEIPENYLYSFVSKDKNNIVIKIITDYNQYDALELITTKKSTYTGFTELLNDTELFEQIMDNKLAVEYLLNSSELIDEIKKHENYSEKLVPIILESNHVTDLQKYEKGLPFYLYNKGSYSTELFSVTYSSYTHHSSGTPSISLTKNSESLSVYTSLRPSHCPGSYVSSTIPINIDVLKHNKIKYDITSYSSGFSSQSTLIGLGNSSSVSTSNYDSVMKHSKSLGEGINEIEISNSGTYYPLIMSYLCYSDSNYYSLSYTINRIWFE